MTVTRFEGLPDIPIVGDTVPNYEASQWYGMLDRRDGCDRELRTEAETQATASW
jgi:hypothetical protein